jgi:hypothetical protein
MVGRSICTLIRWGAYFGSQQNWDTYRQLLAAGQIPAASQMTATESQLDWDFGLWALPDQGTPITSWALRS